MRRVIALLLVSGMSVAGAEPFGVVPALPTELDPEAAPAAVAPGMELLGTSRRAGSVVRTSGADVGFAGGAVGLRLGRGQLTLGRWGSDFYRESRLALAAEHAGVVAIALQLEGRRVHIDGSPPRSALGMAWRIGTGDRVRASLSSSPLALTGERRLFPPGWRLAVTWRDRHLHVGSRLDRRGRGPGHGRSSLARSDDHRPR